MSSECWERIRRRIPRPGKAQKQWILRSQRVGVGSQCTNQKKQQEDCDGDAWEMTSRNLQCEPRALRLVPAVERVEERDGTEEHRERRESQRAQHR